MTSYLTILPANKVLPAQPVQAVKAKVLQAVKAKVLQVAQVAKAKVLLQMVPKMVPRVVK